MPETQHNHLRCACYHTGEESIQRSITSISLHRIKIEQRRQTCRLLACWLHAILPPRETNLPTPLLRK